MSWRSTGALESAKPSEIVALRYARIIAVCGALLVHAGCSSADEPREGRSTDRGGADGTPAATEAAGQVVQDSVLRSAAERVVAFLRGNATYETVSVGDTVELLIPAEGGGARQRMSRESLRDRHAWTIQTNGNHYSFVPPASYTEITIAPRRHFNCLEGSLAARVPEFAGSPHAGVRLAPPDIESCLQGWNATFVFDTASGEPRLTAAIYDQWEW